MPVFNVPFVLSVAGAFLTSSAIAYIYVWPAVHAMPRFASPHLGHSLHWSPRPALEAGAAPFWRTFRSGLKHDVFELLAAGEAIEIRSHDAPSPVGRCLSTARTMRCDQHVGQFVEWAARWSPLRLSLGGVLPPNIERGAALHQIKPRWTSVSRES